MATARRAERNFSPWFQVVTRLAATVEADPLPDGDLAAFAAWRARFGARLGDELAPWPEPVDPDTEIDDGVAADGYRRHRVVFDS